jgi:hypothetical protein
MVTLMSYRATRVHTPGEYSDIFDGSYYQELLETDLVVEGVNQGVKIFSSPHDIALGLMSDGVEVFKKIRNGSATAWPFLLMNYNLSEEIRTHLQYIMPFAIAPGAPKDHNSFAFPFYVEMISLGHGIGTWNELSREIFLLRAFLITKIADMQAFKASQYIRGPNTFSPWRTCAVQGCRDPECGGTNYYYPLRAPRGAICLDFSAAFDWDPNNLPLRTDYSYSQAITYTEEADTQEERDLQAKTHGINGESILVHLPALSR